MKDANEVNAIELCEEDGVVNIARMKHEVNKTPKISVKFQMLATLLVLLTAISGALLGIILSDSNADKDLISWLALPGDLFIRALKCSVLPLVFVNVILALIQMAEAGRAAVVGKFTILVYMTTTIIAALEGLTLVLLFENKFSKASAEPTSSYIEILCPTEGYTLVQIGNRISCSNSSQYARNFELEDVNSYYEKTVEFPEPPTFSESLQNNVFRQLIPENLFVEFSEGGFVGVVMFGIVFGSAAAATATKKNVMMVDLLQEINDVLVKIIEFFIVLTPFAVFSLIVGALAEQDDLVGTMQDIGILLLVMIIGDILHVLVVLPTFFYAVIRANPFAYMKFIVPAQSFAFACASSAASLPVTMRCVQQSGQVPDSIRDFVLPIGATLNMDGAALFFPPTLIFLANQAGLESGFAEYFLIIIASTIGSAGAAPVPNAGILLLIAAFNTVYGTDLPESFGILVGIQFLVDRTQVVVNITGDAMAARIISHLSGAKVTKDRPTSQLEVTKYET